MTTMLVLSVSHSGSSVGRRLHLVEHLRRDHVEQPRPAPPGASAAGSPTDTAASVAGPAASDEPQLSSRREDGHRQRPAPPEEHQPDGGQPQRDVEQEPLLGLVLGDRQPDHTLIASIRTVRQV